jgi:hypothetical protein
MKTIISKRSVRMWMAIRGIERFEDLAEKAEVSPTTIYTIMDTNRFTGKTLDALAGALNVHPFDLLEAEGHPSPHMGAPTVVSV